MPSSSENGGEGAIGDRVRAARKRLGYSREELAYRARLSGAAIQQIESGRRAQLRPETLMRLSEALGVTSDYLLRGRAQRESMGEHRALLYADEEEFASVAGGFLDDMISRSDAALVVTTKPNIEALRQALGAQHATVTFAENESWYGRPAPTLRAFRKFTDDAIARGRAWAAIVGEPVWRGGDDNDVRTWARFEALMTVLVVNRPVTVMCSYSEKTVEPDVAAMARATHPQLVVNGDMQPSVDFKNPEDFLLDTI